MTIRLTFLLLLCLTGKAVAQINVTNYGAPIYTLTPYDLSAFPTVNQYNVPNNYYRLPFK